MSTGRSCETSTAPRHVSIERARVEHDRHAAAAEHVRGPHHDGIPDPLGDLARFFPRHGGAARGLRHAEVPQELREAATVLGQVDRIGRRAENRDAGIEQRQRQLQRSLSAELDDARHFAAGSAAPAR